LVGSLPEKAPPMSAPATVCVDDDLATREASISLWASDDELPGGIDVKMGVIAIQRDCRLAILQFDLLKAFHDHILLNVLVHHFHSWRSHLWALVPLAFLAAHSLAWFGVLRGDNDRVNLQRLHRAIVILLVLDCYLGLAIRPQPPQRTVLADVCQLLAQASGDQDC